MHRKLVRVITGKVPIQVDIQPRFANFGKWEFYELMGRVIKWFIYQKDLLMVLALEDSNFPL
jgi:hypothetical protein